ncbi:hypothetical protein [Eubacterium sp.]|uniref:hypothetical protein n=1 Tax=Eubacterium sp. TaxID=142586 RepID=UPI00258A1386|nr:hypothetical protein [Eubacterium sp.]MCR5368397.1 hypothetical protein [Eubacterium sp.]
MSLFILHRPGILGVSGIVTESDGLSVTVKGDVFLPVSHKIERRLARIRYPRNFPFNKMKLRPGERIIALTEDDFAASSLFTGGETSDDFYDLKAFIIRYSGVFDFEPTTGCAEEHLFSGQVKGVWNIRNGWQFIQISVRKQNNNEERMLLSQTQTSFKKGDNIIALTGKPVSIKDNLCYPIIKIN